jgi:hypothetical protein
MTSAFHIDDMVVSIDAFGDKVLIAFQKSALLKKRIVRQSLGKTNARRPETVVHCCDGGLLVWRRTSFSTSSFK